MVLVVRSVISFYLMLQPHSRLCIFLRAHEPSCQQSASESVVPWCLQDCERAADLLKLWEEASGEELRGVREEVNECEGITK